MTAGKGVLSGLRVVEFEAIGPVPFAGMMLADLGAEVLRIDRVQAAKDLGIAADQPKVDVLGRGKTSLLLDLKLPSAIERVMQVVGQVDIVLEGFRPGTMERLGLGPDVLLGSNPRLVYGRMTGWGQEGPLAPTAGHDINYIALSGLLSTIGEADRKPVPPLNLLGDFAGGAMMLALGVVSAVLAARRDGTGQVVDAAMVDGAALLGAGLSGLMASGLWQEGRGRNLLDGGAPWYDTYQTSDGHYMAVGALEERFYGELLRGLELEHSGLPPRSDRAGWPTLRARLADRFGEGSRDHWTRQFEGTDACVTPVLSPREAAVHGHMSARSVYRNANGAMQPMPAPRFGSHPGGLPVAAPARGEGGDARIEAWMSAPRLR